MPETSSKDNHDMDSERLNKTREFSQINYEDLLKLQQSIKNLQTVPEGLLKLQQSLKNIQSNSGGLLKLQQSLKNIQSNSEGWTRLHQSIKNLQTTPEDWNELLLIFQKIGSSDVSLDDFKKNIKNWLDKEHLSASWLADKLGLSPGTVRNWFSTDTRITKENIVKIKKIKNQYNSSFFNKLFDSNINKPSKICIFPIENESYEAWIASFNIQGINNILNDASKIELKKYLDNSKKNLRDIPLAEVITHDELPASQIYFEFPYASTYLWRKAAGINSKSLNLWANEILDDWAYTDMKENIYRDDDHDNIIF